MPGAPRCLASKRSVRCGLTCSLVKVPKRSVWTTGCSSTTATDSSEESLQGIASLVGNGVNEDRSGRRVEAVTDTE